MAQLLDAAIKSLHTEITVPQSEDLDEAHEDISIPADPTVRNFSYTIQDDKLYFRENSVMLPVSISANAENRIRGMIALRDCARLLIEYQMENYPSDSIKEQQL
ncbi:MAG: hypothetical protein RR573_09770, partial [Oscillospiraceae bacterium]